MKNLFVLFTAIFVINSTLLSDSTKSIKLKTNTTIWQDFTKDLGILATDWGAYLTTPLRMNGKDVFMVSSLFIGTIISSAADLEIRNKVSRRGYNTYNGDFWDVPTFYGYVQYPSILGGAMYGVGLFSRNKWIRTTGRQLIQALIYGGTITVGIRYLTGRKRPFTSEKNQYEFKAFESNGDLASFPSGHMVVAMTTSTILAERIDTWWARAILYPFAFLTGYARLYNDKHWISDIIFGAALGYGSAKFVLNQEEKREKEKLKSGKKKGGGFSIIPTGNGINISYKF